MTDSTRPCKPISPENIAVVSVYANATSTRNPDVVEFESFDELDDWLREPIARRVDKRSVPLFARARVDGPRKKRNLTGPMLVLLDVDKSDASMEETLKALDMQGIAATAHTTWSHGKISGRHSYRVFVDQVADDWDELEACTRELFRLCALESTPESWHSPCFFVPAAPDSRHRLFRTSRTELEESEWEPRPFDSSVIAERETEGPSREISPEDAVLVQQALEHIGNESRDDWIRVGMALCSSGIPEAREIWNEWSQSQDYANYSEDEQESAWGSFDPAVSEGIGIGSIFHMAREQGWKRPRNRLSAREDFGEFLVETTPEQMALVRRTPDPELELGPKGVILKNVGNAARLIGVMDLGLAHDEFAERMISLGAGHVALRRRFGRLSRVFSDETIHAVLWALRETPPSVEFSVDVVHRACLTWGYSNKFNPVVDWLETLEWDGVERLDHWLTTYCKSTDDAFTRAAGRNILLGAVGRAIKPGIKLDTMVVLESKKQGMGKSTVVQILGGEYTLEGLPVNDLRNKDVVTALLGKWFVELDELDVARKATAEALKSFLSRTSDRVRMAYARETRDFPRRCVFVGTTNDSSYLKDATGNRRFLPVKVGWVDLTGLRRDRDQLFAEAMMEWKANPHASALVLPEELWEEAADRQEERRLVDPWEERLDDFLSKKDAADFYQAGELLVDAIGKDVSQQSQNDFRRVKQTMTRMGWENKMKRVQRSDGGMSKAVRGYARPEPDPEFSDPLV